MGAKFKDFRCRRNISDNKVSTIIYLFILSRCRDTIVHLSTLYFFSVQQKTYTLHGKVSCLQAQSIHVYGVLIKSMHSSLIAKAFALLSCWTGQHNTGTIHTCMYVLTLLISLHCWTTKFHGQEMCTFHIHVHVHLVAIWVTWVTRHRYIPFDFRCDAVHLWITLVGVACSVFFDLPMHHRVYKHTT